MLYSSFFVAVAHPTRMHAPPNTHTCTYTHASTQKPTLMHNCSFAKSGLVDMSDTVSILPFRALTASVLDSFNEDLLPDLRSSSDDDDDVPGLLSDSSDSHNGKSSKSSSGYSSGEASNGDDVTSKLERMKLLITEVCESRMIVIKNADKTATVIDGNLRFAALTAMPPDERVKVLGEMELIPCVHYKEQADQALKRLH